MLKSLTLAGFFLATTNLLPNPVLGVPTAKAAHAPTPVTATKGAVQVAVGPKHTALKAQITDESASSPDTFRLAPEEQEFIADINRERTSRGLNALQTDDLLVTVARGHSREMSDLNYFDHHSPTRGQVTPLDRYLKGRRDSGAGAPHYLLVGENIYYCSVFNETYNVAYGHQALMDSPGHRANILEPRFTHVGVGICRDARGQFWVTEMFMKDEE